MENTAEWHKKQAAAAERARAKAFAEHDFDHEREMKNARDMH